MKWRGKENYVFFRGAVVWQWSEKEKRGREKKKVTRQDPRTFLVESCFYLKTRLGKPPDCFIHPPPSPFSPLFSSRLTPRSVFSVAFCLTFSIISYILLLNRFRGTSLCYRFPVLKLSTCFSTLQACLSHLLPGLSCICFPVFLSFSLNLSFYPLIWWAWNSSYSAASADLFFQRRLEWRCPFSFLFEMKSPCVQKEQLGFLFCPCFLLARFW